MTDFTQDLFARRRNASDGNTRVVSAGKLWYDSITNSIRVSDGHTPGGQIVTGQSGSYTLPTATPSVKGGVQLGANIVATGASIDVLQPTRVSQLENDSNYLSGAVLATYATQTFVTTQGYITSAALAAGNANVTAANSRITSIDANLGAYQIWANANVTTLSANAGTQATSINTISANLGAYQNWANGRVTTLDANLGTATTNISSLVTQANANTAALLAGSVTTGPLTVDSRAGGYFANISGDAHPAYGRQTWKFFSQPNPSGGPGSWILFPDGSTQTTAYPGTSTSLSTFDANLGTATTNISNLVTQANANTAAYLTTYTGKIGAGNVFIGPTASANSTRFPNARVVVSSIASGIQSNETGNIGIMAEGIIGFNNSSTWGAGVYGAAYTTNSTSATVRGAGVIGEGHVSNTADTMSAVGVRGYAHDSHGGGNNIGLYASALNGANNYALYIQDGDIYSVPAQNWTLVDNNTSALSFNSAGKTGILKLVTTDSAEGVTMSGILDVTGNITSANVTTGNAQITSNLSVGGNATITSNLSVTQSGLFRGPYDENSALSGVFVGNTGVGAGITPRVGFFNGNTQQNWQIDNNAGAFRWFVPGSTKLTLYSNGNLNVTGSVTVGGKRAVNGPAFGAYAAAVGQTITSGSQQKVLFQTEEFDTDNCYANSAFTPTVEGYYQLNAEVRLDGASGTGEMMIVLCRNNQELKRGTNQSGTQIATNFWAMTVSALVYANGTTDYFEIKVQQGSGGNVSVTAVGSPNITWFNGAMVRGA